MIKTDLLKKVILISIITLSFNLIAKTQDILSEFIVTQNEDGVWVKSCIDMELYSNDLILPDVQNNKKATHNPRRRSYSHPIILKESYWEDHCLVFEISTSDKEDIFKLLEQITILKRSAIRLTIID